jgi:hypothetical protein
VRGERERERGRERKIEKMSEIAIHGVEKRKSRVWVNNPMFFTLCELV